MQITIPMIMAATLLIALILRWNYWWLTMLIIEFIGLYLCIESLMRNLPRGIRTRLAENCKRIDGSWSVGRERVEIQAIRKLRRDLTWVFMSVAVPSNLVVLVLFARSVFQSEESAPLTDEMFVMICATVIVWLTASCFVIKTGYLRLMKNLSVAIAERSHEYRLKDMHRRCSG